MGLDNEDIKQLIAILQRGLTNNEDSTDLQKKPIKQKSEPKSKKKDAPKRENVFDSMPEKRMHQEDIEIDKKLHKHAPTPRRDAFKALQLSCRICGRTEAVDPAIIESADRYKCNKCASSAG
jgi:hypothetical protein